MTRMIQVLVRVAFVAGVLVTAVAAADDDGRGSLVGVVTGPGGSPLPGALVSVRLPGSGPVAEAVAGPGGEFRLTGLEPGEYELDGALRGFHPATVGTITVATGSQSRVEVTLLSATFRDSIEIETTVPPDSLEATELRESAASDVGEALARMPGVWKVRKGGIANDVVVRGYREDDITVLIDGARVAGACPNRMDPPAFHLDFAEVDRVELTPSGGRMAAQGSLGGLVNVVTKKPTAGLHADVPVVVGSFGLVNPSATVGYGGDRFGVLGGVSRRSSSPYEDGSGVRFTEQANYRPDRFDADAFDVTTAWTRLFFQPTDAHELSLSYSHQQADDVLYPALQMDAAYDTTDRAVLGYHSKVASGPVDTLRATVYGTRVRHWMTDSLRTSSTMAPREWGMGTFATTEIVGGSVEAELGSLIFGAEAYRRSWDAWTEMAMMGYTRQFSIPDVNLTAVGLSARWRHALSASTRMELGARIDRVSTEADSDKANTDLYSAYHEVQGTSRNDVEPSASVQLVHQISSSVTVSGSLGTSVRSPDPRERYFGLRRMGGDWVGNPEIDPPRSTRAEIELGWEFGSGALTAVSWVDRVDGYIAVYEQPRINDVPGVMNARARSYANVDALLRGFSLNGTGALSARVSLAAQVSYLRGTRDAEPSLGISSGSLAEMPPLTARLAVRWQSPRLFTEVEGVGSARQDQVDRDLNESPTPGYAIANLKAGATFGSWRAQVVLENLFDRAYHEHLSYQRDPFRSGVVVNEPGRRFALTLGWSM